jgi:hypothetical protein
MLPLRAQQDYSHWNDLVNWDGQTHWVHYLVISPAYLGPNALPVPRLQQGRIRRETELEMRGEVHVGAGDRTFNLYTRAYLPFADGKVAVEAFWVPVEYFRTTPETRDLRRARDFSGRGWATGDVHFTTLIQLLRDRSGWPDLMLGLSFRTTSGSDVQNARYTDAPGYSFELNAGKTLPVGTSERFRLRWHAMAGFYVWQTYEEDLRQNDAISYGLGAIFYLDEKWQIEQEFAGYWGYKNNGDRPLLYRLNFGFRRGSIQWRLGYQAGLQDYPYHSLRLGAIWHLPAAVK